ncbi:MAG: hypothetical protein RIC84_08760 [Aggregatilineales bacterium]
MAEVLGPHTILERALPTGVDGTKIAEWMMQDGISYSEFANAAALSLGNFNASLVTKWGDLFGVTEEISMEYEDGQSVTPLGEIGDTGKPDLIRGLTKGHMIELTPYGGAIGGSRRYFRDARAAKIAATIKSITRRAEWRFEQKLLGRLFTNTETLIGSGGYNVPWAKGSSATVKFTPPSYSGEDFTQSHNHFVGVNSASLGFGDLLNQLAETLDEHGHMAPFIAVVSKADVAMYNALSNIIKIVSPGIQLIDRGGATSGAQYFVNGQPNVTNGTFARFQSDYGEIELRASSRVPTGYAAMAKSYGVNVPDNPLQVRVHPAEGFGAFIVPETVDDKQYPIQSLNIEMELGIGVGMDRTQGAAGYLVSGGAWANPTIS